MQRHRLLQYGKYMKQYWSQIGNICRLSTGLKTHLLKDIKQGSFLILDCTDVSSCEVVLSSQWKEQYSFDFNQELFNVSFRELRFDEKTGCELKILPIVEQDYRIQLHVPEILDVRILGNDINIKFINKVL